MQYIRFEIKKFKGTGLLAGGLLLTLLVVAFQGYAAMKTSAVKTDVVYVTAMDLFSSFLFPLFISLIVIRSFSVEKLNNGFLNYYCSNISLTKVYRMKMLTAFILGVLYFFVALVITAFFISRRGVNPLEIYIKNWKFIVLFIMALVTVINITSILYSLLKNPLIPGVIVVIAVVFESLANALGISYINPWGYFEISFYYRGLGGLNLSMMIIVFILSMVFSAYQIQKVDFDIVKSL